jgi:hypothetical protein
MLRSGDHRRGECSAFVELARRMSVPAEVAIREYLGFAGKRPLDDAAGSPPDTAESLVLSSLR